MPTSDNRPNQPNIFYLFIGFILLSLAVRLLLVNWYSAPYTDGVFLMTLFESFNPNNSYPPLYSALIYLINYGLNNPILSGRLISIASGVGIIYLVFLFGRRFFSEKTGLYAALIYGTAPLAFRWDLRVMTDSLFALFFFAALYFLYRGLSKHGRNNFLLFNFFAVLSALTRYQGLVFLTISLIWLYFISSKQYTLEKRWEAPVGFLCWLFLPGWMIYRGFSHTQHYQQFLTESGSFWLTLGKLVMMLEMFIPALIYALGYLTFALMLYGIFCYRQKKIGPQWFLGACSYLFFAFWLAHSAFLVAFQTRYFFPFWPLAALFCGVGLVSFSENRKKVGTILLTVIILSNVFWSGLVLYHQKDSFGSLRRSAEYIAKNLPQDIIITCEDYKVSYFSKRFIKGKPFTERYLIYSVKDVSKPPPGSYVYINSLYTDDYVDYFTRHKDQVVYTDQEDIIPILPDIGLLPFVNRPAWFTFRFYPQAIYSAIIKVGN